MHVRLERAVHVLALVADVAHQIILCPYVRPPGVPISMRGSTQVAKLGSIRTLQGLAVGHGWLPEARSFLHTTTHYGTVQRAGIRS